MSCPFYAHAMHPPFGIVPNPGSNQCALITSAHSPCWMEVSETRDPDWTDCPRNPEWAVTVAKTNKSHWDRWARHEERLEQLFNIRHQTKPL